jgi:outer membrane protein assembly factor BamB
LTGSLEELGWFHEVWPKSATGCGTGRKPPYFSRLASHRVPAQPTRFSSLNAIRIATFLLPPLGLILLWRNSQMRRFTKLLGTGYILAWSLLYVVALVIVLAHGFGVDLIEWRKGYLPVLVVSKRLLNENNYAAAPRSAYHNTAASWSGFRGANRDGVYQEQAIATNWPSSGPPRLWRHAVGGGYSSMTIAEGLVFTIEQRREKEVATAYDVESGREVWRHGWEAKFDEAFGGEGPRATPTYDDGRLYAQGATGDLLCLEAASGKLLWQRNIITENQAELTVYGVAASPLIVDEKVVVLPGGHNGKSVVAYNKRNGALIWQSMSDSQAYTSPMFVTLAGQRQVLVVSARNIMGLAPEDGRLLWQTPWVIPNDNAIAQPVLLGPARFLVSAGYGVGSVAFQITQSNSTFLVQELWRNHYLKNKFSSSVACDGCVYGLDETILTCLDAATGERKWKEGRYGYGQLLLAGKQLVVLGEDGILALVEVTPAEFRERARFQAILGKTWNPPAMADGKVFVRNAAEMACYELGHKP